MVSKILRALAYIVMAPFLLVLYLITAAIVVWLAVMALTAAALPVILANSYSHGDFLTTLYGAFGSLFILGFCVMIVGGVWGTNSGRGASCCENTKPTKRVRRRRLKKTKTAWNDGSYQRSSPGFL
jgi:hypothetical protein